MNQGKAKIRIKIKDKHKIADAYLRFQKIFAIAKKKYKKSLYFDKKSKEKR